MITQQKKQKDVNMDLTEKIYRANKKVHKKKNENENNNDAIT